MRLGLIIAAVAALGWARGLLATGAESAATLEALPTPRRSWPGVIARVLARWVRGPRPLSRPRWYDSDGAHRGF